MFDIAILFKNKSIIFRYMYQLQNHTNVGYSNLIYITYENNIKVVKQPFLEKQWQIYGKTIALTFLCLKKVSKVSRKCLEKCKKCLAPR